MKFSRFTFISFTVTVADPAVFTAVDHELTYGDTILLETTGALPTGLEVYKEYYVIRNGITSSTFQLSLSKNGDPIVTTGTQSGSHTFIKTNRASLKPLYENNK